MSDNGCDEILENLFDGVYYVDREGVITLWNKAAERLTGYSKQEVIGSKCSDNILRHITDYGLEVCENGCPLHQAILDGCLHDASLFLHHKQGHRVPVHVRISPIINRDDQIVGAIEVFSDNSKTLNMIKELETLRKEVLLDPMIRIGNRRFAEMAYETSLYQLCAFNVKFGVLLLDIDNFKKINDRHGHKVGDDVLVMVSRSISNTLRNVDTLIRWGGEEFLVILPNISEKYLVPITERIRTIVEHSFVMVEEQKVSVTVSGGATLVSTQENLTEVFEKVDKLVYESKRLGRNRISIV